MRTRDVRGIPLWLLREYLVESGGRASGPDSVAGEGWTARLTQIEDYRIGHLSVGEVRMELEGDAGTLDALEARLAPRLLRGGG
jgi:molybdopterin synthase sulfur carrier subunit